LDRSASVTAVLTTQDSRPVLREIEPQQAWFWTAEWQARERQADAGLAVGRSATYHGYEEFLAHLDRVPPVTNPALSMF
jgi:hypothetical protein